MTDRRWTRFEVGRLGGRKTERSQTDELSAKISSSTNIAPKRPTNGSKFS